MRRGGKSWVAAAGLLAAGCAADNGQLQIRAIADPGSKLRQGNGDLAAARGQLLLGNVGLALEAFRKLQRAQPENVDVLAGIAECYSAMGRNDLARANYEAALAIEPRNSELLRGFAAVLDRSGQHADTAEVRREAARVQTVPRAAVNAAAIAELPAEPATESARMVADRATVRLPAAQPMEKLRDTASNLLTAARDEFQIEAPAVPPSRPSQRGPAQQLSNSVTVPLPPARPAPIRAGKTPEVLTTGRAGAGDASPASSVPLPEHQTARALSNSVTVRLPPARPAPSLRSPVVNLLSVVREDFEVAAPVLSPPARKQPAAVLPGGVTVQLPPARSAARLRDRVTNVLAVAAEVRIAPAPTPARTGTGGPRLERLSPGEVALVTTTEPIWRRPAAPPVRTSATVQWIPLQKAARPNVLVLNAARFQGVAGRARTVLADRGWRRIQIGDARTTREKSVVLYPAHRSVLGRGLAAQFGFAARLSPDVEVPTLLLGRDAAALRFTRRG